MSVHDELRALAEQLAGITWKDKHPSVWGPGESAAFNAATEEEKHRYVAEGVPRLAAELGGGALSMAVFYWGDGLLIREYVGVNIAEAVGHEPIR